MRSSSTLLGFVSVLIISLLPAGDNWQAKATTDPPIDSPPFTRHQVEDHIKMAERQIADIRPGTGEIHHMGGQTASPHSLCNRLYSRLFRIKRGIEAST